MKSLLNVLNASVCSECLNMRQVASFVLLAQFLIKHEMPFQLDVPDKTIAWHTKGKGCMGKLC